MRVTTSLLTRGNPKEPVPFQELLPLKLRNHVSGKGDKTSEVCCLYEMSVMFACLKDNDFKQSLCAKEIASFQNCYTDHTKRKSIRDAQEAKGTLTPGEKKLSHKQLNKLLSMFPNVK